MKGDLMSVDRVRTYVKSFDSSLEPIQFAAQTRTSEEAAAVLGVEVGQIAKSILFKSGEKFGLFVMAGDVRVNQKKVKVILGGGKPKMASPQEVEDITGFQVGGVCPFALKAEVSIFLDESLARFDQIYTAAGSSHSVLAITLDKLQEITKGMVSSLD